MPWSELASSPPLLQRCVVAWEQIAIPRSLYTSFRYTIPLTELFSECVQAHKWKEGQDDPGYGLSRFPLFSLHDHR